MFRRILAILLLWLSTDAGASLPLQASLGDLACGADHVLVGRVVGVDMLAEDGEPPTVLRERVTSPGGTTAAALEAFAHGNLRALVAGAVAAATERGRELSEKYS